MTISIVTTTFNRKKELEKLYFSIKKQTLPPLEWIIIDDGSTDGTQKEVKEWINEKNEFAIIYQYQANGGKHTAFNLGVTLVSSPYTFMVDSDDILPPTSLASISTWLDNIVGNDKIAGVAGMLGYQSGGTVGSYPKLSSDLEYIECSNLERRKYNLLGDKAEVYRTDLLLKYPFRVFPGENFLTESTVWDKIAEMGYVIRWYEEVVYLCEYNEGGLSDQGSYLYYKNFKGYTYVTQQRMKLYSPLRAFASCGKYSQIARKKGYSFKEIARIIDKNIFYIYLSYWVLNFKQPLNIDLTIENREVPSENDLQN